MIRKLSKVTVFAIVLILLFQNFAFAAPKEESPFDVKAKSALLMDYGTGEILYEKNPDEKLPIASVTKVMTILLAMEAIDKGQLKLTDKITVSENASKMGGSQVYLERGGIHTVDEIMKSIVVASGNDASVAMAEKLSGTQETFVKKMNDRAAELGMKNTHFANCTGLPAENHYSTARDVAIMSKELLKHPTFHKWSTIWIDYLEHKNNRKTILTNTNRLVKFYDGADGIKTGSTSEALYCLSATAKRGSLRLISIILGAPSSSQRFADAQKMMDYGFANYQSLTLLKDKEIVKKGIHITGGRSNIINAVSEKEFSLLVKKGEDKGYEKKCDLPDQLRAPIKKGQKLGEMIITKDGKEVKKVAIVADRDIKAATYMDTILKILNKWIQK